MMWYILMEFTYLGIYVLICCNDTHVLGWYVCRYENARAWQCLMERIAEPKVVVSDGANDLL